MTLAGVLGFPVAHSRSPAMMNAAFRTLGLDWRYLKLPVPPERFEETVHALPGSGYLGANVTVPHKLAALRLADEATEAAAAIGAVNTLSFSDGAIAAENTDAGGLLDALGSSPQGLRTLVLGAGGAGRAAAWALREGRAVIERGIESDHRRIDEQVGRLGRRDRSDVEITRELQGALGRPIPDGDLRRARLAQGPRRRPSGAAGA